MNSSVALNKFRWQLQSVRLSLEREIKIRASQAGEAQRPQKTLCQVYTMHLSGHFSARREVVKIQNPDFFYWAWSTPWGYVLSQIFFVEILSWAEQWGIQFFSLSNLQIISKTCLAIRFQLFDIWWSNLDISNDFKAISRIIFFRFGEIKQSLFWVFSKKCIFSSFFIFRSVIMNQKKIEFFFLKKLKIMISLFHRNGKRLLWKWP